MLDSVTTVGACSLLLKSATALAQLADRGSVGATRRLVHGTCITDLGPVLDTVPAVWPCEHRFVLAVGAAHDAGATIHGARDLRDVIAVIAEFAGIGM
jgi:hypothetical protein